MHGQTKTKLEPIYQPLPPPFALHLRDARLVVRVCRGCVASVVLQTEVSTFEREKGGERGGKGSERERKME